MIQKALQILAVGLCMTGCTQFPQLDAVISPEAKRADYPALVPQEQLTSLRGKGRLTEETGENLLARAKRLQARADILRRITAANDETRLRIADRLRRLGG